MASLKPIDPFRNGLIPTNVSMIYNLGLITFGKEVQVLTLFDKNLEVKQYWQGLSPQTDLGKPGFRALLCNSGGIVRSHLGEPLHAFLNRLDKGVLVPSEDVILNHPLLHSFSATDFISFHDGFTIIHKFYDPFNPFILLQDLDNVNDDVKESVYVYRTSEAVNLNDGKQRDLARVAEDLLQRANAKLGELLTTFKDPSHLYVSLLAINTCGEGFVEAVFKVCYEQPLTEWIACRLPLSAVVIAKRYLVTLISSKEVFLKGLVRYTPNELESRVEEALRTAELYVLDLGEPARNEVVYEREDYKVVRPILDQALASVKLKGEGRFKLIEDWDERRIIIFNESEGELLIYRLYEGGKLIDLSKEPEVVKLKVSLDKWRLVRGYAWNDKVLLYMEPKGCKRSECNVLRTTRRVMVFDLNTGLTLKSFNVKLFDFRKVKTYIDLEEGFAGPGRGWSFVVGEEVSVYSFE